MTFPRYILNGCLAFGLLLGQAGAQAAEPAGRLDLSLPADMEATDQAADPADALPRENRPRPYRRGATEPTQAEELPYGAGYEARQLRQGGGSTGALGGAGRSAGRGAGRGR